MTDSLKPLSTLICIFALVMWIKAVKTALLLCSNNKDTAMKRILLVLVNPLKNVSSTAIGIFICELFSFGFKLLSNGKISPMLSSSNTAANKVRNITITNFSH